MNIRTRIALTRLRFKNKVKSINNNLQIKRYHVVHSMFKWTKDEEGDITFRLFWLLNFTKYKEHTIIKFGWLNYEPASKYVDA